MTIRGDHHALRAALAILVAGASFLSAPVRGPVRLPEVREKPLRNENPVRRWEYEWMRVRDPRTGQIPPRIRERELAFARAIPDRETLRRGLPRAGHATAGLQEISWTERGPYNVGGRTRAFAQDVTDARVLLAGGVSGGMWRSIDGGSSWLKTTAPDQLHSLTCLVQDTRAGFTSVWYYGTGELRGNSAAGGGGALYRGDGIFKSTDGGRSWAQLPATVSGTPQAFDQMFDYVWNLVIDTSGGRGTLYAATIGGIARSTDGGASWSAVLGGTNVSDSRYTDVAVSPAGVLYATLSETNLNGAPGAASQGVWRSTNGTSWVDIRPGIPPWPGRSARLVLALAPSNERVVYVLGETPGYGRATTVDTETEWNSFWKYTYLGGDGRGAGGAWEDRSLNLPGFGGPVGDFLSQGSYNLVLAVHPRNDSLVFFGGTNLYRTTNGLRTSGPTAWIGGYATQNDISQYPGHHCDQHVLFFDRANPDGLYNGNDGGVFYTGAAREPAVEWQPLNSGYNTTQFYTVAIDRATAGNPVIIGGTQDNSTLFVGSSSPRASWLDVLFGDGSHCAIADGRSSYYASAQDGLTYRLLLTSSGTLTDFTRVDPQGGSGYLFINPFILDPSNGAVMYMAGGTSLWRNGNLLAIPLRSTSPASVGWTRMTGATPGAGSISALGASTSSPRSRLYYGTSQGQVFRLDEADRAAATAPATDLWTGKGLPNGAYVSCIAVDPADGDRALLVFSNYGVPSIYSTTDAGRSWSDVSGNLEERADGTGSGPSVRWAAVQRYGGGPMFFVGTSTGLYSTLRLQGGATQWVQEGAGTIGRVVVDMIQTRSADGLVAVGTHGQGVWTGISPPVGSPPVEGGSITALGLPYPNPVGDAKNAVVAFTFTTGEAAHVRLSVFDLNGREVARLVDEEREPGRQPDAYWYPGNVASGVYFCMLSAGSESEAVKFLVVR